MRLEALRISRGPCRAPGRLVTPKIGGHADQTDVDFVQRGRQRRAHEGRDLGIARLLHRIVGRCRREIMLGVALVLHVHVLCVQPVTGSISRRLNPKLTAHTRRGCRRGPRRLEVGIQAAQREHHDDDRATQCDRGERGGCGPALPQHGADDGHQQSAHQQIIGHCEGGNHIVHDTGHQGHDDAERSA